MFKSPQSYIVIAKRLHPERRGVGNQYLLDWGYSYDDAYKKMYIAPDEGIYGRYSIRNERERQAHNRSIRVVPTDNAEMKHIMETVDREIPYATPDQRRDRIREEIIKTALRKSPANKYAKRNEKTKSPMPKVQDYGEGYVYKAPWQEILKHIW